MSKIKLKATYGGYKEIAQNGLEVKKPIGYNIDPDPNISAQNIPVIPINGSAPIGLPPTTNNDYSGVANSLTNVAQTGADWYSKFNQMRGKLANGISNGIAVASGLASIFDNAQLRRREQEQKIESLQGASYENSNRGINNIPAYTKYGGNGETNVEAEAGEVFDNGQDILKIDDQANSHEEGGVDIMAERVLENTSTHRKDTMSKALRLNKDDVETISGFKAKRGMSHSDAYEFEAKETSKIQKKTLDAISKVVSNKNADKYAIESGKLNADLGLAKLPSENEIFDKYFESQESIKENMGFYDGKVEAKYGKAIAEDGYINPYKKGKQKSPTGKNTNFPDDKNWNDYKSAWEKNLGKTYTNDYGGTYDMQFDAYTNALETNPQAIRDMWKTYGLNNKAKQNGVNYDTNNLTDEQLLALRNEYVDGLSGARMIQPLVDDRIGNIDPLTPRTNITSTVGEDIKSIDATPQSISKPTNTVNPTQKSTDDNTPLQWYDTIGPTSQILSALRRDPELYNPVNIAQLKLQQQDVRPALNNSQAEYNAASQNLSNDSVGAAQKAQLFSNKLRADNTVIGQYENANKQIQNQETQYNTNARDRQEAANAQSRESFYTKVLQGRAKQEEQLLTGIDAMAKTFAENRAFNRNANLINKLAPNFNKKGDYNGVPVKFASNSSSEPGFVTTNGKPTVNEKGQYLLRSRNKDGKVSEEYVDKSYYDKITGTASGKAIENKIILDAVKGGKR